MAGARTPQGQESRAGGSNCPHCGTSLQPAEPCLRCLLGLGLGLSSATALDGLQTARYTILNPLGQGGMGEVFLAHDTALDRKVALKFLSEALLQNPGAEKHLLDEARAAAALDHPFVCKVYETGDVEGSAFIAMEYVEGQTLRQMMDSQRLPLEKILRIADAIADALQSSHRHGIVHRDLKPSNVMLTADGHVKVMDFGIARRLEDAKSDGPALADWTRETSVQGSVLYMSPQQARGEPADARSDIFSLGVMIYEMIAGHNPFHRKTPDETWQALLSADHPPLSSPSGRLPRGLRDAVDRMLAPDPQQRYQDAGQVRRSLQQVRSRMAARQSGWRKWVRSPLRLSAMVLVMLTLVAGGVYWGSLTMEPAQQASLERSENPQAQDAYVEGRRRLALRTPGSLSDAVQRFRQAVGHDPEFAAAWAGLAEAQILLASYGIQASAEVFPEARRAALQALRLDSRQSKAHTALAFILFSYDWDWEAAEEEFLRARRLAPRDSDTLRWYGFFLATQGRMEEALALMQQARDEDPISWLAIVSLARCRYLRGEYDLAAKGYQEALVLQPEFRPSHLGLGLVYLKQAKFGLAAQSFRKGLAGGSPAHELLAEAFLEQAERSSPRDIESDLQALRNESGQVYLSPYFVAVYYQALGRSDRVFEWLEKAYQERSEHLVTLRVDPVFENLHSDGRFQHLAQRVFQ